MTTLLHIKSSLFGGDGQSSQLSDDFVARWQQQHAGARVISRDLALDPVPHLDGEAVAGFMTEAAERNDKQRAVAALSEALIEELKSADVIVIGLPMYNFGVPSTFKAWIDHVARAGLTFRYTESGPEGFLTGKKAYVFAARGGIYQGTGNDTQTPYVKTILGFLGITDVTFVAAEGLNMGDEAKASALAAARAEIDTLVTGARLAA